MVSDSGAPRSARRALDRLSESLPREILDSLQLLASELVTNSVRHAARLTGRADPIDVRVVATARTVRLEVSDRGPGFDPQPETPTVHSESGWGLYLVEKVADRWGVLNGPITRVWLEIDLPAR